MDFNMSDRQKEWLNRVQAFMQKHVRPAVPIYKQQDAEGPRWKVIPVLEEVKKEPTPRRQFHLAMSYLKSGRRDQGEKTLQLALQQDPKLPVTEKGW